MNISLLTANSKEYTRIAARTLPGKAEYCARHGYQLVSRIHEDWLFTTPWGERERFMLEELGRCNYLFFTGADLLITNHTVTLEPLIESLMSDCDMLVTADRFGMNNDAFILKWSDASEAFLHKTIALNGEHSNDQNAMWEVMNTFDGFHAKIIGQTAFNSYLYEEYGEPGREGSWEKGQFCCHLPGMSNERRIELLDGKLLAEVVR